jgi:hypothetical protein
MAPVCGYLAILGCLLAKGPDLVPSYLVYEEWRPDGICRVSAEPYGPQPGDLIFFTYAMPYDDCLCWLGLPPIPEHCAIVIAKADGSPALLECAPEWCSVTWPFTCILDPYKRFQEYNGKIHVRRLKCPLTEEQSAALTAFALEQKGKPLAVCRWVTFMTLVRPHGPHSKWFGKTDLERHAWFCSELTVAAAVAAGLLDPQAYQANVVLPHDLFDDKVYDLSGTWLPAVPWSPNPGCEVRPPAHVIPCGM